MNTLKIYTATIKDTFLLSPILFYHQFSRDLQLAYHLFVISPQTLEREARCSAKNIEQYLLPGGFRILAGIRKIFRRQK